MYRFWQLRMMVKPKGDDADKSEEASVPPKGMAESYFVGQEFVEDSNKIDVYIKFKFRSAVIFTNIDFDYSKLHIRQLKNGEILGTLEKKISLRSYLRLLVTRLMFRH